MTKENKIYILIHGLYLGFANVFIFDGSLFALLVSQADTPKAVTTTVMFAGSLIVFLYSILFTKKDSFYEKLFSFSIAATLMLLLMFIFLWLFPQNVISIYLLPVLQFFISAAAMLYMISTISCMVRIVPVNKILISMIFITLLTYLIVYITEVLMARGHDKLAMIFALAILATALLLAVKINGKEKEVLYLYKISANYKMILLIVVATFLLNFSTCGISMPAYKSILLEYSEITIYLYMIPLFIIALLLLRKSKILHKLMDVLLILAACVYAIAFALLIYSSSNVLLANLLLQAAYPVIDVILWSLAIQMIHFFGKSNRIAALMTFAIVFSAYLGVTGGELLIFLSERPQLTLAFASLIGAIVAIMLIPVLNRACSPHIDKLQKSYAQMIETKNSADRILLLTKREQQIVRYLSEDYLNKEIADMLGISDNTIKTHARNIYTKLDVKNKRELKILLDSIEEMQSFKENS